MSHAGPGGIGVTTLNRSLAADEPGLTSLSENGRRERKVNGMLVLHALNY
jgi:hypothetical protein